MVEPPEPLRLATLDDVPAIRGLIDASVRVLSAGYYSDHEIASSLRYVFGPDTQLIADATYYVIEADGAIVAAGGWSRRATLYGGDQMKDTSDAVLDPAREAARIRAFFVHPAWTRRGLARRLYEACAEAARAGGFRELELVSTLPGEPLYRAIGFTPIEELVHVMPDGQRLRVIRMRKTLDDCGLRTASCELRAPD
ncbi:MAG TPA: GNAT family N-acetyltransferase [Gemmatimonadaceae bacterium]|nr:GNAT family N-acetyltransferase [Gemmatimonadaceae bacterium]